MAKPASCDTFGEHLARLRDARCQTDEAVKLLGPAHKHALKSLSLTWELVFDYLSQPRDESLGPDDLNTISGIIYKLAQSSHRLKSLEHDTLSFEEQQAALRRNDIEEITAGLPPDLCERLERTLNLL